MSSNTCRCIYVETSELTRLPQQMMYSLFTGSLSLISIEFEVVFYLLCVFCCCLVYFILFGWFRIDLYPNGKWLGDGYSSCHRRRRRQTLFGRVVDCHSPPKEYVRASGKNAVCCSNSIRYTRHFTCPNKNQIICGILNKTIFFCVQVYCVRLLFF